MPASLSISGWRANIECRIDDGDVALSDIATGRTEIYIEVLEGTDADALLRRGLEEGPLARQQGLQEFGFLLVESTSAVEGGTGVAGGQGDGNIYGLNRATCELFFSQKTSYKIESDPVFDGDRLYFTSGDMKLYAFKINKKK